MAPFCAIPVRPKDEEKKFTPQEAPAVPAAESPVPATSALAATPTQNVPPAPQAPRKKTGPNIFFSLITSLIITALTALILFLFNFTLFNALSLTILALILIGCFILFFSLRHRQ